MQKEKIFVLLQFEDGEYLLKRHVDIGWVLFGSTGVESSLFPASGIAFDGGSGVLDHIVMNFLSLFFLPVMH